jgi:hypothetical protein
MHLYIYIYREREREREREGEREGGKWDILIMLYNNRQWSLAFASTFSVHASPAILPYQVERRKQTHALAP